MSPARSFSFPKDSITSCWRYLVNKASRSLYGEPTPRIAESDGTSNDIQTTSKRHPEVLIKWADSAVSLLGRTGCRGPTPLKQHRHPVFGEIHEVPHFRR